MSPPPARRRTRVLEVVRPPDGTTRYIDQVVSFADPDIQFRYFSPASLLRMNYDVVHFHWPETIVRHDRAWAELCKAAAFSAWVRLLRLRGRAIVRTVHNLHPHDGVRPAVRHAIEKLDGATDLFVGINPTTELPEGSAYIPHGHYRDRFSAHPREVKRRGLLAFAGRISPYKGVEELLGAFGEVGDDSLALRIVGQPTPALRGVVEAAAAADPSSISARLEFIPDADLVAEITRAELICLPYREMHNSGIALVALSLDRPVLVPDTVATRALAAEVGHGWVTTFTGELQSADIHRALAAARDAEKTPRLEDRDWQVVGARYSAAFRTARDRVGGRRGQRSRARPSGLG